MNKHIKIYLFLSVALIITLIFVGFIQQREKDVLYKLFTDSQAQAIKNEALYFEKLKDISCSFLDRTPKEREYINLYIAVYSKSMSSYLSYDYISEDTKNRIKEATEYVLINCRNKKT